MHQLLIKVLYSLLLLGTLKDIVYFPFPARQAETALRMDTESNCMTSHNILRVLYYPSISILYFYLDEDEYFCYFKSTWV